MKKIYTSIFALFMVLTTFAQTPEQMSYQAVIRDSADELVTNTQVGMQISILQGTANGSAVYVETQTPTTNVNGLVSLEIGTGTPVTGTFATIDWATGPYFIKTETDPSGGATYSITGTSQLMSVPYALYAKESGSSNPPNLETVLTENNSANNQQIKYLADPTEAQDATTKAYVDGLLARIEALEESDVLNNGFTDTRDGNHYNVVKIGDQVWMAENLRTTTYANGDPIPNVTDSAQWQNLTTGAWAHYNNDSQYENPYGKLYNWYTVADSRNVCPTGWHVPTDAEYNLLSDYLGGAPAAGGKMKSTGTQYWSSPNTDATNESGFSGLPGGERYDDGTFLDIGYYGYWWSSTEADTSNAWYRTLHYNFHAVMKFLSLKESGLSVRCLMD